MHATHHDEYRPFQVHVSRGPEAVHVGPDGEIDLATAGRLQARIDALLAERPARLVLDLHDVTFIDSTGVRLVVELARAAPRDGWELLLIRMPHHVQRVFALSGVLDVLPLGEPEAV